MADVTISQLGVGTPTTGIVVPWSDGTTTYQAKLSSLITATGDMGTGAIQLPRGTDAQRPTAIEGQIRYNSTIKTVEFYNGIRWVNISTGLIAEVLIVGGGGSGGNRYYAGGGGAGGLIYNPALILAPGNYPVVVGQGGVATTSNVCVKGVNGNNSSFLTYVAFGGGGGGSGASGNANGIPPGTGGSGGGGSLYTANNSHIGAAGTTGQGYTGGNGRGFPTVNNGGGGGGGGSGGVGGNSGSSVAGLGGIGLSYSITGASQFYAGGGGGAAYVGVGGAGGSGVGGNGANENVFNGGNAVQNTGSGGGGGSYTENNGFPGSGANGVVIIAYPGSQAIATGGTISTTSRPGYVVHTFTYPGGTFNF